MPKLIRLLLCGMSMWGLWGCVVEPNFSDTPFIAFQSCTNHKSSYTSADSIQVTLRFEDGDGDLGLSQVDTMQPYQLMNPDGTTNKFYYNYFAVVERQNSDGTFSPVVLATENFTLNGRYPRLYTTPKPNSALEGTLRFAFPVFYGQTLSPIRRGDVLRFKIKILDRGLRESNEITSTPITMGKYQ